MEREHHEKTCVFYQELEDVQLEEDIKISTDGLEEVRNYTKDDEALLQLGKFVTQGWPNERSAVPENIRCY